MAVKHRRQIDTRHEQIIPHIVLALYWRSAEIRRNGYIGCARDIAGNQGQSLCISRCWNGKNVQLGAVIPDRVGEVAAESVNQDLVLIELEDNVGQPPIAFALEALPVANRIPGHRL